MEAREGTCQVAPEGQQLPLEPLDQDIPPNPEKGLDSFVSSRDSSKLQPSFPPVLTYPLCPDTVVR